MVFGVPAPEPSSSWGTRRSSQLRRISTISDPMVTICSCFIPAVVTAGVPIRRPEVMNGERGSKGMALRFNVIPMSSSSAEASLPVRSRSRLRRSTRNMWFSVPPDTIRAPSTVMVSAITLAEATRMIWGACCRASSRTAAGSSAP